MLHPSVWIILSSIELDLYETPKNFANKSFEDTFLIEYEMSTAQDKTPGPLAGPRVFDQAFE